MSVQVENLEKNMAKLTIEIPAEDLEKAIQAVYLKQKSRINIPGFRKGKVPYFPWVAEISPCSASMEIYLRILYSDMP